MIFKIFLFFNFFLIRVVSPKIILSNHQIILLFLNSIEIFGQIFDRISSNIRRFGQLTEYSTKSLDDLSQHYPLWKIRNGYRFLGPFISDLLHWTFYVGPFVIKCVIYNIIHQIFIFRTLFSFLVISGKKLERIKKYHFNGEIMIL